MPIDWKNVNRVLLVRLRSIGDTVLATPSLIALQRFLPDAEIDILLEDWVAPVLDGSYLADNIVTVGRSGRDRFETAWKIRKARYDVVFNLHGGTTGTFFSISSGARHRVGYEYYQYSFLYNHKLRSSAEFWDREPTHSAEQQLALLGSVGVPVADSPKSRLAVTAAASGSLRAKFRARGRALSGEGGGFALIHPAAAFATKQWAAENFAEAAEFLEKCGFATVAVAAPSEKAVLDRLSAASRVPITTFDDLTLPEITALAAEAAIFVGNDSGIAHIAAAVGTPTVVIFGSSNVDHWRPWTDTASEVVRHALPCQPCPGYECAEFGDAKCIRSVTVGQVNAAVGRILDRKKEAGQITGP